MTDFILEMKDICKVFPGVKALDQVSIQVGRGEIHAICGENGAGKSTLIKVLSGVYPAGTYDGEIVVDGKTQSFEGIEDAEKQGIICIHQELALVPELSVGENIFLGNQPNRLGVVKWDEIYYQTQLLLEKVGLAASVAGSEHPVVTPDDKIKNLGIGQQQLVEIAKALSKKTRLLILDEPTAALTEKEVDILLDILDALRKEGVTSIYISHKLDEVMRIADSVTVIRDGKSIGTSGIKELTKNKIISMMVGRELTNLFPRVEHTRGEVGFEVKNFSVDHPEIPGKKLIHNVSFKAYKGEILGVSGLMGAGRTELFSSIYGAFPAKSEGEVYIDGKRVDIKSPGDAIGHGLSLVTEDRKRYGLVLDMNIKENTTMSSLGRVSKNAILNESAEVHYTNEYVQYLKTKTPSVETRVRNLSGGNQQKVVLGKVLMTEPKVLVLDEPTRGIDVGAKYEIYKIMNMLVEEGVVVIMVSSDLEEVLGMSDRILVMGEGKVRGELAIDEANQEKIMMAATGGLQG
ncbi:xylose ABC transporter ATP-binding protein [Anaerotalea alkaliphila]|uniref:Xylose ABC transporter ATP-binding protein n=1 Tax=Anaerotalea alkaliphila TaxID=2662126 RepID=A0A7X5KP44_9FIRM|nr:xylose ABC transporter ATP-binding protein [Anaerotalea alkaliphila]NDL67502.1 xylose ABC transporter ATP-binding protein [Anaerotalea alkaliphila]